MTPSDIARETTSEIKRHCIQTSESSDSPLAVYLGFDDERAAALILSAAAKMPAGGEPWRKCSESLPEIPVIVWVSEGGGTALLARYDRYRWESATTIRQMPFTPIWWKPLTLPESPGPLRSLTEHKP